MSFTSPPKKVHPSIPFLIGIALIALGCWAFYTFFGVGILERTWGFPDIFLWIIPWVTGPEFIVWGVLLLKKRVPYWDHEKTKLATYRKLRGTA